ncbi:MAG: hypothetical protein S0880_36905, partial [Actinomycetota bacterium]|nr:hypothetical protein [Actinomycetota bacterium]
MSWIATFLATTAGKAAAGTAAVAASVGGLHATEVVEVPVLSELTVTAASEELPEGPVDAPAVDEPVADEPAPDAGDETGDEPAVDEPAVDEPAA